MSKLEEMLKKPPILECFKIVGLNGIKNLSLTIDSSAKIIVAENGTGKTTLLNALYAVLSKNPFKLLPIDFESITLKFCNQPEFFFRKSEIFIERDHPDRDSSLQELLDYGVEEEELFRLRSEIGQTISSGALANSSAYSKAYQNGPYDPQETITLIKRAMPLLDRSEKLDELLSYVKKGLGNVEVLYLPTFRRIEVEISQIKSQRPRRNPYFVHSIPEISEDSDDSLIWFGMGDVEAQLDRIKTRIKTETFDAYSRLSVQSLGDLLSPNRSEPEKIESNDENIRPQLSLVLARLGQDSGEAAKKIWELIDTEEINNRNYEKLRAYLFQMLEIYTATQRDEKSIEDFTKVINNYWSTSAFETSSKVEKEFFFDKMSLSIDVRTPYSSKPLQLGNLSSGEKQIVSIFAKLNLQKEKRFIVVIDEPELSLSMAWQKLLLPDILKSPSCMQLIAITHSPFIFENELDPYAGPLFVSYQEG